MIQLLESELVSTQRNFFRSGATFDVNFRIEQLQKLTALITSYEPAIYQALKADLNKPEAEAYTGEISILRREINYAIKNLKTWVKPQSKPLNWVLQPGSAKVYPEPLGVVLIIGAWNYPIHLSLLPLVGAIAAGNCAIIKPSEIAPASSQLLVELINQNFASEYVHVVPGDAHTCQALLACPFDHIFFTGSPKVGKIVMAAAAQHLTSVTLELGGKNPCIVDQNVDIDVTARRIILGKFYNCGQSCVAPDYLLVHSQVKSQLINAMQTNLRQFYGDNPALSPDYARIINQSNYQRLINLLSGKIIFGGETHGEDLYIAPTLIDDVNWDDTVMKEEIFGPILPIITYTDIHQVIREINSRPKPLALYIFSRDRNLQRQILRSTSSGTVAINDTVKQYTVESLPFGGVGSSGIGKYHGKANFDTFSHYKSILQKPFLFDVSLAYPPYADKLPWLRRLLG